ncbi:MAG: restriction endonuclease subunit R, partial [Pseudomonadota bacterium]|nr:restriction endonuclease subunit R [Pseudomonadota bacterium]
GLTPGGSGRNETQFVSWLEKQCRAHMFSQADLSTWLAGVVADLIGRRHMSLKDLVDWEHRIAAAVDSKLKAVALRKKNDAFQLALFEDADIQIVPDRFEFSDGLYRDLAVQRLPDGQVFNKHLLGARGIPKVDGNPLGEEFQCAVALNRLDNHVDVWIRNVAKHSDSFRLMRPNGHFYYPDFVARLKDGRIFVVEYKGAAGADRDDTREKAIIANLWAEKTGNIYAVIEKMKHGKGMADQMIAAIEAT